MTSSPLRAQSTADLLEKGIYVEETEGNLPAAIEIYKRITATAEAERPTLAQALLRLGVCYAKSGQGDKALSTFHQLARRYPDQKHLLARIPEGYPPARRAVAVLGFKNLSGRAAAGWLGTALAETLSTELAAGGALRVMPAETVAEMRSELSLPDAESLSADTLRRIREFASADLVLVGSYLAPGDSKGKLRIDMHLQDTVAGQTIAAATEVGSESDVIEMVGRIGGRVRAELGVATPSAGQAAVTSIVHTRDPQAMRLYSEGLVKLRRFELNEARDLLEKAVIADPQFARAHIGLSEAWSELGHDARAIEAATNAVRLAKAAGDEERLLAEARLAEADADDIKALETYQSLFALAPDQMDYGLRLAHLQIRLVKRSEAMATAAALQSISIRDPDLRVLLLQAQLELIASPRRAAERASQVRALAEQEQLHFIAAHAALLEGSARTELDRSSEEGRAAIAFARKVYSAAARQAELAGVLLWLAGRASLDFELEQAARLAQEALDLYAEVGSQRGIQSAMRHLGANYRRQGRLTDGLRMFDKVGAPPASLPPAAKLHYQWYRSWLLYESGELAAARRPYEENHAHLDNDPPDGCAVVYAMVLIEQGDLRKARALLEKTIAVFDAAQIPRGWSYRWLADILLLEDQPDEARRVYDLMAQRGLGRGINYLAFLNDRGQYDETLRQPLGRSQEQGAPNYLMRSRTWRLEAFIALGKREGAAEEAKLLADLAATSEDVPSRLAARAILAWHAATASRHETAATEISAVVEEANRRGYVATSLFARLAQARVEHLAGRDSEARSLLEALRADAQANGFPVYVRRTTQVLESIHTR